MTVKLLTEQNLEFLSLTGGCTGSSEPTLVKMPHCWKSHVTAHMYHVGRMSVGLFILITLQMGFVRGGPTQIMFGVFCCCCFFSYWGKNRGFI